MCSSSITFFSNQRSGRILALLLFALYYKGFGRPIDFVGYDFWIKLRLKTKFFFSSDFRDVRNITSVVFGEVKLVVLNRKK